MKLFVTDKIISIFRIKLKYNEHSLKYHFQIIVNPTNEDIIPNNAVVLGFNVKFLLEKSLCEVIESRKYFKIFSYLVLNSVFV